MTKKTKQNSCVGEALKITASLVIRKFLADDNQKEFEFPSSLTSTERAFLHHYCQQRGLKTKSRGKGSSRYLTVYKKEGSTIVQADAIFDLGRISRQHTINLLQRYPVSAREKQELLPPTERDRMINQDGRDVNRTTGRLNNGIPQVPPRPGDSEFTSFRQGLPIWFMRDEIINTILRHQVVFITGETGTGKTTQIPQFILDHCHLMGQQCRIICTQPRRLATLSVAERVAQERDEKVGQTVGFQIRLESRVSPKTVLTFCTNGVLLRTLMGGDATIATVTHIIVDEVHERDKFSDFLLLILRDLLLKFRNLKLILMSAALDTQLFVKYFGNCPLIEVPGRAHEVKEYFLEDILRITNYSTKSMQKYRKELVKMKDQRQELANWCKQASGITFSQPITMAIDSPKYEDIITAGMASLDALDHEDAGERTSPEPHLASELDRLIKEAWFSGSDALFENLMNFLICENLSVDYQHRETGMTPLMIASGRGKLEVVEQLLSLGANTTIQSSNNWTALDWAMNFNQTHIKELLSSCSPSTQPSESTKESQKQQQEYAEISSEDKIALDVYHHCFNDDQVDLSLILKLLHCIITSYDDGAILIFLPGYDDIVTLREKILTDENHFPDSSRFIIYTLHSQIQSSDQKRVFKFPPPGVRKIILATNIAETSITINDVVFVIDSGKVKEKLYDSLTGVTSLQSVWVSQASALQRKGRAGRCRPGVCYHLMSHERFFSLQMFPPPEILRTPVHELCLQAKLLAPPNISIADFLARAPDPPSFTVTRSAVTLLKTIDSLDPWEELTELGLHLLDLPVDPRLGKMVLYSVVLKCLDPVLTIVCALAYKDPFLLPFNPIQKKAAHMAKKKLAADTFSDHMALLRAFQAWQKARSEGYERTFCEKNFLSAPTLEMIVGMRTQLLGQLRASGFVRARGGGDIRDLNSNSENWAVVKAAICAGTYPNLIRVDRDRRQLITQKETKVRFHPSSILNPGVKSGAQTVNSVVSEAAAALPCDWLVFEEMMRGGRTAQAYCCTLVSPITVALVAGPARLPLDALHEPEQGKMEGYMEESDSEEEENSDGRKSALFKLDDWISFKAEPEAARLTLQLRQKWHALFLRRMHTPAKPWSQVDEAVVKALVGVLTAEEQALGLQQPPGIGQRPRPMATDFCPPISMGNQSRGGSYDFDFDSGSSSNGHPSSPIVASSSTSSSYYGGHGKCSGNIQRFFDKDEKSDSSSVQSSGASPCHSPAPLCSAALPSPGGYPHSSTRYFIIKASSPRLIDTSFSLGVWAFTHATQRKLMWTVKEGKDIILIFSIQGSGHFQGFAAFIYQVYPSKPLDFNAPNLGNCYKIQWIRKENLPFQSTCHLLNPWNDNRKVQISRDGQELEPSVGEALCKLWDKIPKQMDKSHF